MKKVTEKGTFREHSGNIQFELRWMPVSPHPNCKEHFMKVPRLTHYDLPTWVPKTREHSGNTQGTLREHSGNIQGTFREHSVRVERTPVSLHPNCKKHLKKVPRLT
jgi:hypothetical protein